jgi:hypothetical protein
MPFTKTFNPGEILTAADVNDHLLNGGYQYRETVYFTSSGTFVKADYPWLRAIRVKCVGAGGGGRGREAGDNQGGGGGGGGYAEKFITDIAGLDATVTVTRGNGGPGGIAASIPGNGTNGGTSSFGSLLSASGGQGCASTTGGAGGSGTGGDLNMSGNRGDADGSFSGLIVAQQLRRGRGGDSPLGWGFGENYASAGGAGGAQGRDGINFGGGGSGGIAGSSDQPGGSGSAGIVVVELYA